MVVGEASGAIQYIANERMEILSGSDGAHEGLYAESFKGAFEEKRKFRSCSLDQIRWFNKTR